MVPIGMNVAPDHEDFPVVFEEAVKKRLVGLVPAIAPDLTRIVRAAIHLFLKLHFSNRRSLAPF
jgi:hypothetical protein